MKKYASFLVIILCFLCLFGQGAEAGFGTAMKTAAGAADGTGGFDIDINIPANAYIMLIQLRVDKTMSGNTASTWSAAIGGQTVTDGNALDANTKVSAYFDPNADTPILASEADITISPDSGDLTTGAVSAWVTFYVASELKNAVSVAASTDTFTEASENNGLFNQPPITITVSGTRFVGSNRTDFLANSSLATLTGLPAGLTATLTRMSPTTLDLRVRGKATAHANSNDTTATLLLKVPAFQPVKDETIVQQTVSIAFDFADPPPTPTPVPTSTATPAPTATPTAAPTATPTTPAPTPTP